MVTISEPLMLSCVCIYTLGTALQLQVHHSIAGTILGIMILVIHRLSVIIIIGKTGGIGKLITIAKCQ